MKILFSLIFFALISACNGSKNTIKQEHSATKKPVVNPQVENEEALIGRWQLYKVDCCGRNKSTTMAEGTEDANKYLKFTNDGMVKFQDHGTLEKKVPYSFENVMNDNLNWIKIGDKPTAIYTIKGDTLILNWEYMDLQLEYYLKF